MRVDYEVGHCVGYQGWGRENEYCWWEAFSEAWSVGEAACYVPRCLLRERIESQEVCGLEFGWEEVAELE
jgi:hypothetical protein